MYLKYFVFFKKWEYKGSNIEVVNWIFDDC